MLLNLTISALEAGKLKDAEKYANEMLRQAKEPGKRSWNYWTLSYYANFTLGMVALKREKIEDACKYLLAAGNAPGSPFPGSEPYMLLADELLEKGKRECVIKFLKSCSRFWKKDVCSNWIKKIESGATPELDKDKWLRRKIEKKYQNQPLK